MTAKNWSREIAAITPFVQADTVRIEGTCEDTIPGIPGDQHVVGTQQLADLRDGSVGNLVGIGVLAGEADPITTIRTWYDALQEGGTLAVVLERHTCTPQFFTNLINLIGGFEVQSADDVVEGETWILNAKRTAVAAVRTPLGVHGQEMATAANGSREARAELYFHLGTILLQAGDPELAETCFQNLLGIEVNNADAWFGIGMCYGTMGRWTDALTELHRAASLQPDNPEIQRWVELARNQSQANAPVIPQATPVAPRTGTAALRI